MQRQVREVPLPQVADYPVQEGISLQAGKREDACPEGRLQLRKGAQDYQPPQDGGRHHQQGCLSAILGKTS